MIVGFATRGQGRGAGPVGYCVQQTVIQAKKGTETRNPPPTVLRGDPAATERLIDSLSFKYKYKSGVLSFTPGETITPAMEQDIMDRFEAVAFAGLDPDQYDILWVRHEHAGHHELHFVTPRVELTTSKSLNICPPGPKARQAFDDYRSMINAEYGLSDPDDPARERDLHHAPGDRRAVTWEALGLPEGVSAAKRRIELRELAHQLIAKRVEAGLIRDRKSMVEQCRDLGFEVTRASRDSVTLLHPDDPDATRFKMKGAIYGVGWELERTVEAASSPGERDFTGRDRRAAERYAERVAEHIRRRTEYHRGRYAKPEQSTGEAHEVADSVAEPVSGDDLAEYLRRSLGVHALSVPANPGAARDAGQPGDAGREAGEDGRGPGVPEAAEGDEPERDPADPRGPAVHRDIAGVGEPDDRIGADLARRIASIRAAADRATEGARQCAQRAGACLRRVRAVEPASRRLAETVSRFERLLMAQEGREAQRRVAIPPALQESMGHRREPEKPATKQPRRRPGPKPGPTRGGGGPAM